MAKRTYLEFLKEQHPELEYLDHNFYTSQESEMPIQNIDADLIIETHYNGYDYDFPGATGNPEDEFTQTCTGFMYIQYKFDGDYLKAFENA